MQGKARRKWVGIYRSSGIGDLIVASSPVALLAKDFNVEVLCDAPYGNMWDYNPHVAKITEIPADTLPKDQAEWQKWFRMRSREVAAFYNLSQTMEATLALGSGQPAFDWPASARRRLCGHSYLEFAHDVCEVPHDFNPGPRFYASPEEKADAKRVKGTVGDRVIGVPVSGSRIDKTWPHLPQLVAKILREIKVPVVLFGGANARDVAIADRTQEIVQTINGNADDLHCCISKDSKELTVEWSMRRNLAQFLTCDLIISPDTGMAWAAAMEPMPKIVLLSHASPENITKHWHNTTTLHADPERVPCWPCHRLHDEPWSCNKAKNVDAAACMEDIHSEIVLRHVHKAMEQLPKRTQVGLMPIGPRPPAHETIGNGMAAEGNVLSGATVTYDAPEGYIGLRRGQEVAD